MRVWPKNFSPELMEAALAERPQEMKGTTPGAERRAEVQGMEWKCDRAEARMRESASESREAEDMVSGGQELG